MKVRILGCSGGIGGRHARTTSMLVDHDILIDAGTGVADLSLAEMAMIDDVFITHSHLDHIAALPLMIDSVADMRDKPITIHATDATLAILRNHIFNWAIWPDFSEIAIRKEAVMQYRTLRLGEAVELDGRRITAVPADHTVPAVGYHLDSGRASLVFTGDTTANAAFWSVVNAIGNLRYLIVETAFSDQERQMAVRSKHLCPSMLAEELAKFSGSASVFITHLKPGQVELIMGEIEESLGEFKPKMLQNNQIFEL